MLPTPTPVLVLAYGLALLSLCSVAVVVSRSSQRDRLAGTWSTLILGACEIAFAIQIRTWHGPGSWSGDPDHKVFYGSWLASELWVNRGLVAVGAGTMLLGVAYYLSYPRLARLGRTSAPPGRQPTSR